MELSTCNRDFHIFIQTCFSAFYYQKHFSLEANLFQRGKYFEILLVICVMFRLWHFARCHTLVVDWICYRTTVTEDLLQPVDREILLLSIIGIKRVFIHSLINERARTTQKLKPKLNCETICYCTFHWSWK